MLNDLEIEHIQKTIEILNNEYYILWEEEKKFYDDSKEWDFFHNKRHKIYLVSLALNQVIKNNKKES